MDWQLSGALVAKRNRGALALLGLFLAACAGSPTATPAGVARDGAAATPVESASTVETTEASPASPAVTETPTDEAGVAELRVDGVAQVVTTDLVVRSAPGVDASSEIFPDNLDQPTLLFLVDGPVSADGYDWYLVEPFTLEICLDVCGDPPFGWVAAADHDGEPWIAPATLDCPEADIEAVRWLSRVGRLACYGGGDLVLVGSSGGCFAAERPEWFFQTGCVLNPPAYARPADSFDPGGIGVFGAISGWPQDPASRITATGHFDDPAALACQGMSEEAASEFGMDPSTLPPPELANLECRAQFVVTDLEVDAP